MFLVEYCGPLFERLLGTLGKFFSAVQLGLDRMELPSSAVHPVSRKRPKATTAEADSPSSGTPSQTPQSSAAVALEPSQTVHLASAALERLQEDSIGLRLPRPLSTPPAVSIEAAGSRGTSRFAPQEQGELADFSNQGAVEEREVAAQPPALGGLPSPPPLQLHLPEAGQNNGQSLLPVASPPEQWHGRSGSGSFGGYNYGDIAQRLRSSSLPKEAAAAGADLSARVNIFMQQQRTASQSPTLLNAHGHAELGRDGQQAEVSASDVAVCLPPVSPGLPPMHPEQAVQSPAAGVLSAIRHGTHASLCLPGTSWHRIFV